LVSETASPPVLLLQWGWADPLPGPPQAGQVPGCCPGLLHDQASLGVHIFHPVAFFFLVLVSAVDPNPGGQKWPKTIEKVNKVNLSHYFLKHFMAFFHYNDQLICLPLTLNAFEGKKSEKQGLQNW
jgi:hypothetical protein